MIFNQFMVNVIVQQFADRSVSSLSLHGFCSPRILSQFTHSIPIQCVYIIIKYYKTDGLSIPHTFFVLRDDSSRGS